MKKIGPLSLDLVVACKIYELQSKGTQAEFTELVESLKGLVGESTIPALLRSLSDWGIVATEFGETKQGRAGRFYYISGEAYDMIKETYELFWDKVAELRKT
jgi:hypothetical protein